MSKAESRRKPRSKTEMKFSKTTKKARAAPKPTQTPAAAAAAFSQPFAAPTSAPARAHHTRVSFRTWNRVLERLTSPTEVTKELKTRDPCRVKESAEKGLVYTVA